MVVISNYSSPQFLLLLFTIFNTNILWSHMPHENYNIHRIAFYQSLHNDREV